MKHRIFWIILLAVISFIYFLFPNPQEFWIKFYQKELSIIHKIEEGLDAKTLKLQFRNHEIGPSRISIVWVGMIQVDPKLFLQQLKDLDIGEVSYFGSADVNGLVTSLIFNTDCGLSPNVENVNNMRRNSATVPQANRYKLNRNGQLWATIYTYPIGEEENFICGQDQLRGTLVELSFEVAKKYP